MGDPLEIAALKSAEATGLTELKAIAAHLYGYNSLPAAGRWASWFRATAVAVSGMGATIDASTEMLRSKWVPTSDRHWLAWTRVHKTGWVSAPARAKLYISPRPDWLPKVVPEISQICMRLGAERLKVGRTLPNLLRPDKMVAYWTRANEARHAGTALLASVREVPGHRVPFTARIRDSDVLSWAMDPPHRGPATHTHSPSWRAWVVKHLAGALARALRGEATMPPWQYALWSARQHGIDTDTWIPNPDVWERPSA